MTVVETLPQNENGKSRNRCVRCLTSNSFTRLFRGAPPSEDLMDESVNALALICALLLTIPFGIMPSLNFAYWEKIGELSKDCPKYDYTHARGIFIFVLGWSVYLNVSGIVLVTFYYVLKPKYFDKWFRSRGKYLLTLLILVTLASLIVLILLFGNLFAYYNVDYKNYCASFVDITNNVPLIVFACLYIAVVLACLW
eukprot:GILI01017487.1.p1 GENE.GILI01017487.1~~GILI01017487.1.p1  ORF type:complete len:197 (-),score=3.54 GILI01017487.1:83-673(-)